MTARIAIVTDVRPHGDNLTIVKVQDEDRTHEIIANLQDDGRARYAVDELVVYVSEDSIIPDDVLQERNYWKADTVKGTGKGMLGGKKGNRVRMRVIAGFESRGLLFKTRQGSFMGMPFTFVDRDTSLAVTLGDDVTGHLGIEDHGG